MSRKAVIREAHRAALAARVSKLAAQGVRLSSVTVPMRDGVSLSVDLLSPRGVSQAPVLLEYHPYRKTSSRGRNYEAYAYFAQHGYVVAIADIRGTGDSEGKIVPYAYSEQEHEDGEDLIAWLADQEWSSGLVGMVGISYSGFNALQMTLRHPPALKAVLAIDATESLFQEDVYFIDGIFHVDSYELRMDLDNARPGAPDYTIDEGYFQDRFDATPYIPVYKRHQRDGAFWDRASMLARYDQVDTPIFLVGGWYDGYRNSIPRMLENLHSPVKAIVGPWSHAFPHEGEPGPGIEWRREAVRWFDYWLKGVDTGIMDEPRLAVFMRDYHPPGPEVEVFPGEWKWLEQCPSPNQTWHLHPGSLRREAPETPAVYTLRNKPSNGVEASGPVMWWGDVAPDQRPTDKHSFVHDTPPLEGDITILGRPQVHLVVSADAPQANWFLRLSDVAPDGSVTLVTGTGFNGTHRESSRAPQLLTPGEPFSLDAKLYFTSWVFRRGHRIRLSISNAQWPMFWPTPFPTTTLLYLGEAILSLPVTTPSLFQGGPQFLAPGEPRYPRGYPEPEYQTDSGFGELSSVSTDTRTGERVVRAEVSQSQQMPWGEESYHEIIEHRVSDAHPDRASMRGVQSFEVGGLRWSGVLSLRSDRRRFRYTYTRILEREGVVVRKKRWRTTIPRDHQ